MNDSHGNGPESSGSEGRLKPGPLPRMNTRMTTMRLEPDLIDWAKAQQGGFSETVRRLLRAAMEGTGR